MCDGVGVLHSGHWLSLGARQRFAPRRNLDFILEVLRFGAAMVLVLNSSQVLIYRGRTKA